MFHVVFLVPQIGDRLGVSGRTDARAEASIVKADCPNVSAGFILDPSLAAIYGRGKQVAGLA
jgi:hypothetical protein